MTIKIIKNNKGYNGACDYCYRIQEGSAEQPLIVYYKKDNGRGKNYIACCEECAKELVNLLNK